MTPADLELLHEMLTRVRAHGYVAQRVEVAGVVTLDLALAPAEELSPGEQAMRGLPNKPRGERGFKILRLPNEDTDA